MKVFQQRLVLNTLRKVFVTRLLLLLVSFSIVTTIAIATLYQQRLEQQNQADLRGILTHMVPRLKNQDRLWREDANHVLNIFEWSDLLALKGQLRTDKLNAFFTAQSESIGFDGFVMTDATTRKPIFDYWAPIKRPDLKALLINKQSLWLDEEHKVLYSRITLITHNKEGEIEVAFFKAWESDTLNRLSFSDTEAFLTLGTYPLISSAGRLALESAQPKANAYSKSVVSG